MQGIEISNKIISFLTFLPMFLISITVHEFSHAILANKLGDDTAKKMGRLTLNPFKHADIIGTLVMPLASFASGIALIGWAKPVPIDRSKFKNRLLDDAVVSFAGPLSNFLLAVIFFIFFMVFYRASASAYVVNLLWYGVFFNVFLFAFNLLPVPPLDGVHILYDIFPNKVTARLIGIGFYGSIILLFLIYSPLWGFFMDLINYILKVFLSIAGL
ncbi:MAG TPA: site-2 protease family protein [Ignavibacteriaceae bacterium]|nr:site-2 protease family protein [Ignavibacteriaceae bacterium]